MSGRKSANGLFSGAPKRSFICFVLTPPNKAKDFANEITNYNINKEDLKSEKKITDEHVKNNKDVRGVLTKRGIVPEQLPAAEDLKKIERRHESEAKKLTKN